METLVYLVCLALYFFLFSFVVYWTHRWAHTFEFLWQFHKAHHSVRYAGDYEFSVWNLFGWFNDLKSTLDQWITEILPLGIMIWIWPGAWPLAVLYYIDGFVLAEGLTDHNPRINIPGLAMGRYHLMHHRDPKVNFDQYFRLWDTVFGTKRNVV